MLGFGVVVEGVDRHQRHGAADRLAKVTAADSDAMRDAATAAVDQGRDLLEAGPRGRDDTDGAAPHAVGEGERRARDQGRATVRPHEEKAAPVGVLLEGAFLRQRHVIAEKENVKAPAQRLPRLSGGEGAGNRDQGEAGAGKRLERAGQ